jgi:hypothetical protein
MDIDCEATPSAIFSISLPRHLYKICDTEVHATPPFTIFTTAKIYDLSPQLSVTQNVTFQPQEKHTATKYEQKRHGTINANGGKNACLLLYIGPSSERTTRKLKSNRFPSHSYATVLIQTHTYTYTSKE